MDQPQASGLAAYWLDENGVRYTSPITVISSNVNLKKQILLKTPKVLAAAKAHFGCDSLTVSQNCRNCRFGCPRVTILSFCKSQSVAISI